MPVHAKNSDASLKASASQRPHGALYLVGVLFAATFVLVVAMGRAGSGRFEATAVLLGTATQKSASPPTPDSVQQEITGPTVIQQTLDGLAAENPEIRQVWSATELSHAVRVQRHAESAAERMGISVSLDGGDADQTMAVVNRLCEVFVRQQASGSVVDAAPAYRNEYAEAQRNVKVAEQEFNEAKQALSVLEFQYGRSFGLDAAGRDATELPVDSAADGDLHQAMRAATADQAAGETELQIAELNAKLQQATSGLEEVLKAATPEHPLVGTIRGEIGLLESRLSELRAQLEAERDRDRQFPVGGNGSTAESPGHAPFGPVFEGPQQDELVVKHAELAAVVRLAGQKLDAAKREESRQWERRFETRPALVWYVEPATSVERMYRPTAPALLAFAGVLAVIVTGGLLLVGNRVSTIDSAAAAEAVLSVPVVGILPDPGKPAERSQSTIILRLILLCAETALLVFLLSMVVAALLDRQFAGQLRADPLSALADSVQRLFAIVGS